MKAKSKRILLWLLAIAIALPVAGLAAIGLMDVSERVQARFQLNAPATNELVAVETNFYAMQASTVALPGPRWGGSGAISALDNAVYFVSRTGEFHVLDSAAAAFRLLPIAPPFSMDKLLDNHVRPNTRLTFGAKGLLVERHADGLRLFLAHHFWNDAERCYVLRLSEYRTAGSTESDTGAEDSWRTLFDTTPCISPDEFSFPMEAGGKLARLSDDELLLTVGDHAFARMEHVQDTSTSYGKVLRINTATGAARVFTMGHRNPQGLFVDSTAAVWSTEHGPKGGDELNLLADGGNYGWPLKSYGTAYDSYQWRTGAADDSDSAYRTPTFAWTPSIGITGLIVVRGAQLPLWRGDLLISSLREQSLFRVRVRDGHTIAVEQIQLKRRLRDIAELADGRLALLADTNENGDRGQLILLRPNPVGEPAEASPQDRS